MHDMARYTAAKKGPNVPRAHRQSGMAWQTGALSTYEVNARWGHANAWQWLIVPAAVITKAATEQSSVVPLSCLHAHSAARTVCSPTLSDAMTVSDDMRSALDREDMAGRLVPCESDSTGRGGLDQPTCSMRGEGGDSYAKCEQRQQRQQREQRMTYRAR
jgi:hypothetical protein